MSDKNKNLRIIGNNYDSKKGQFERSYVSEHSISPRHRMFRLICEDDFSDGLPPQLNNEENKYYKLGDKEKEQIECLSKAVQEINGDKAGDFSGYQAVITPNPEKRGLTLKLTDVDHAMEVAVDFNFFYHDQEKFIGTMLTFPDGVNPIYDLSKSEISYISLPNDNVNGGHPVIHNGAHHYELLTFEEFKSDLIALSFSFVYEKTMHSRAMYNLIPNELKPLTPEL